MFKAPSGTYWIEYRHQGKRVRQSLGETKQGAAAAKAEGILAPLRLANDRDRRVMAAAAVQSAESDLAAAVAIRDRLSLAEVWEKFPYDHTSPRRGTRRKLSPRNVEENRGAWRKLVTWAAATHEARTCMEDITPEIAVQYSRHLQDEEHLTAGRHNKLITTARAMYRLAKRPDPFQDIQRESVTHESREPLEVEEVRAVCAKATGELRALLAVGLYCGLRLGDAALMRWEDIRHDRIIRKTAKTKKTVAFPVHPELRAVLNENPGDGRGYIMPELAAEYKVHGKLSRRVKALFESCGLETTEEGTDRSRCISRRGFHSMRHTFATICARANVPIGLVREWLGHSSESVTRIYEHWQTTRGQEQIIEALPTLLAPVALLPAGLDALRAEVATAVETAEEGKLRAALAALRG